uniref:Uncharacterized protein n=1 Tax=Rhizophora mucronata TaxID=61149 RepID=A0A2P2QRZ2_RHIMU
MNNLYFVENQNIQNLIYKFKTWMYLSSIYSKFNKLVIRLNQPKSSLICLFAISHHLWRLHACSGCQFTATLFY